MSRGHVSVFRSKSSQKAQEKSGLKSKVGFRVLCLELGLKL